MLRAAHPARRMAATATSRRGAAGSGQEEGDQRPGEEETEDQRGPVPQRSAPAWSPVSVPEHGQAH